MALFAIGDLHLSLAADKPMDKFGHGWENYVAKLSEGWRDAVAEGDTVVLAGDLSWGMSLAACEKDFSFINGLPGHKLILKGNHDYYWTTASGIMRFFAEHGLNTFSLLHNNCAQYGAIALCGTRGWFIDEVSEERAHNEMMYNRERIRLEASLKAADALGLEEKYVFLHYPPVYKGFCCDEFFELFAKYGVTRCFYGHLHGYSIAAAKEGLFRGVELRLISADKLGFRPLKVCD